MLTLSSIFLSSFPSVESKPYVYSSISAESDGKDNLSLSLILSNYLDILGYSIYPFDCQVGVLILYISFLKRNWIGIEDGMERGICFQWLFSFYIENEDWFHFVSFFLRFVPLSCQDYSRFHYRVLWWFPLYVNIWFRTRILIF